MTSYARAPVCLGNHPLLKRVASEPTFPQYDTSLASTMPFKDRRELVRSFRVTKGNHKLQKRLLETRKSLGSLATLAKDKQRYNTKDSTPADLPSWYIPLCPKEDGLGEMLVNKSVGHYKTAAREREIHPNAPNQKDCIGNRWTGWGSSPIALPVVEVTEG